MKTGIYGSLTITYHNHQNEYWIFEGCMFRIDHIYNLYKLLNEILENVLQFVLESQFVS